MGYILPEWAFDILHEFVYQFQGFCQFRTQTAANVASAASGHKYNKTPNMDTIKLLNTVFQAKLSLAYHAGVSYLMLRRYKDATRVLGDICANMQRLFKTGMLRKLPGATDQFQKLYDRMIALLAIVTHICPAPKLDEGIVRTVREKHGNQLLKIESGEEGYEDLFIFACPKFITPSVPDYNVLMGDR